MDIKEFNFLQSLPLDVKVAKTKQRIREWVYHYGIDGVYVSFSGGKDSTVLLHICREIFPEIKAVFVDTGLEYPELRQFVKTFDNVEWLRPKKNFKQVIEDYGYPVVSKEQSRYIYDIKNSKSQKLINLRLNGGEKGYFKLSKKWTYLLEAPFKISDKCCNVMKKAPVKSYEKKTGRVPIIGMLADESNLRRRKYLKEGCNAFENARPSSMPLGFWTEQDILQYIKDYKVEICSVYGGVIEDEKGKLKCKDLSRTGCVFCMYGIHLEKGKNRFQKLEETHPQLHNYCMNKLGFKEVCEYMNIPYDKASENNISGQINFLDEI